MTHTDIPSPGPVSPDRLYERLPAVHRLRDHGESRPLQALLRLMGEQADIVEQHIDRFWDDLAIETCDDWVVPYIGDLVANEPLAGGGSRARVDVAKTISYRRRKGTLPMLEELARDVTGWGARAVEMLELLGWTQHLEHLRSQASWFDIRDPERTGRVDGPFDEASHSVDVRPPPDGLHAISTVAFFLWRLRSYPVQGTVLATPGGAPVRARPPARQAGAPNLFWFSSLGAPLRLFSRWRPDGDEAGLAVETSIAGPIRPAAFHRDLGGLAADPDAELSFYGPARLAGLGDDCYPQEPSPVSGGSLAVFVDDVAVPADRVLCKDLSTWAAPPAGSDRVAVDVATGRIAFAPDAALGDVTVEYHYGFAGDIGAGPYDRRRTGPAPERLRGFGPDTVADPDAFTGSRLSVSPVGDHSLIGDAVAEWEGAPGDLPPIVIGVDDDGTYTEHVTIDVTRARRVVLQAANGRRPTLLGDIRIVGDNPEASVAIDGLLVAGTVEVAGELGQLRLSHCTIVPGTGLDPDGEPSDPTAPALVAPAAATRLQVLIDTCISGPLRLPATVARLHVHRSIIDGMRTSALAAPGTGDGDGPPTVLEQVTALGSVHVHRLDLATDLLATGPVLARRTQQGCVRFSFVPEGSRTPRRYRCQPDLALEAAPTPAAAARVGARLHPVFVSTRFGDPGYAQLARGCPAEIAVGGEDGTEMGAFAWLRAPHRLADLDRRLREHLPFGLTPAPVFVT